MLIKNKKSVSSLSPATGKYKKKSTKPFNKQDNKSPKREKEGSKIDSDGGNRQSKSQPKNKETKSNVRSGPRSDSSSGKQQSFKSAHYHHKAKRAVVKKPLTPAERKALKPHFKLVSTLHCFPIMLKHVSDC